VANRPDPRAGTARATAGLMPSPNRRFHLSRLGILAFAFALRLTLVRPWGLPSAFAAAESFARAVTVHDGVGTAPPELSLPGAKRAMNLEEALKVARRDQPALASATARLGAAAADQRIARAEWLPTVGATLQGLEGTTNNTTASYLGVQAVGLPRIGGTRVDGTRDWSPSRSTLAAIGLEQEVLDFGRIAATAAVADLAFEGARHHANSEWLRIELLVKEAYYGVEGARAVLRAADDAFRRASVHRDMAAAEVKTGLFAPIELTRAESDLTRFDVGRIRARGSLTTSQAVFAAAVGVPDLLLDAGGDPPLSATPPSSAEEGIRRALGQDPVILEGRSRIAGAEAEVRAIAAELRPKLLFTSSFSERSGNASPSTGPISEPVEPLPYIPNIPNWNVGLVLTWPIFDGVVLARGSAAASRVRVAQADATALERQEAALVQQAYVTLEVDEVALVGLARAADAALANYSQAEARFKAGLGTSLEIADAESMRTDAEIQLAVGQFNARRSRAVLARLLAEES
jgi:outer membrane protein